MRIPKLLQTACVLAVVGVSSAAAGASGDLRESEREALLAGDVVSRPMRIESEAGSYHSAGTCTFSHSAPPVHAS